ncbi:MAG: hypothetical protein RLZZ175_1699 [Bacteroidota bacterium]|jgi:spore coat polysaccharide biosynthesis protein SpsF (cytidylyltransferase family)
MAYHLYFVKNKNLTLKNIDLFLETPIKVGDNGFIEKEIHDLLIDKMLATEIDFSKSANKLLASTFEVAFYNEMIAISWPYWSKNVAFKLSNELAVLTQILFDSDFILYDPQLKKIISHQNDLLSDNQSEKVGISVLNKLKSLFK